MKTLLAAFAVCPSGLEPLLAAELAAMPGITESQPGKGGVSFRADPTAIARVNLWSRLATRILVLVDQVRLRGPEDLLQAAQRIAWEKWLTPDMTIRVDVNQGRPLHPPIGLALAALKIKDGLCDRLTQQMGRRPSVDTRNPDIRVWAYLDGDKATISVDTTGEPLFKRGWRLSKGEAPLRENLAAALIQMTEWRAGNTDQPLFDPMCGSGTLLIEAASWAAGLAPGFHPSRPRPFSFEQFASGSPFSRVSLPELQRECAQAWQRANLKVLPPIVGRDLDPELVMHARANAARALPEGIAQQLAFSEGDFFEADPPQALKGAHGMVVCNPPYGKRLELGEDARRVSEVLKQRYTGQTVWLLSDDLKFDSALRLKAARRIPVYNGDLDCRWMRFDMVAGSARRPKTDESSPQP